MKRIALTLLITLALLVVACGGGGSQQGAAPTAGPAAKPTEPAKAAAPAPATKPTEAAKSAAPAPTTAAAAPAGKASGGVQLMGWSSSDAENTRLQQMVKSYQEKNPSNPITLNLVPEYDTKLQTALAGGVPPDVFYVDTFKLPDLVKAGALAEAEGKVQNKDDFFPFAVQAFTIGGKYYCPAKDFSTLALIVNTDMLNAAGLKAPTTWEELKTAAQKLTNKDKNVYGIVIPNDLARWIAFLYQAGGNVLTDDKSKSALNSPEAKQALDFYAGLYKDGFARMPGDVNADWPGDAFGKQVAAMVVEGNWIVPFLKDKYPNVKWQAVELPAGPKGKATMAFTVCYAVPAKGKNPEASWDVVNFLTGPDGMKQWTDLGLAMPTRKSLMPGWQQKFPELKAFGDGAAYARPWQFVSGFGDVMDTFNNNLKSVMQGRMTSDQALKETDQVITQVLSKK